MHFNADFCGVFFPLPVFLSLSCTRRYALLLVQVDTCALEVRGY